MVIIGDLSSPAVKFPGPITNASDDPASLGDQIQVPPPPYNINDDSREPLIRNNGGASATRFFKALFVATVIYVILGVTLRATVFTPNRRDDSEEMSGKPTARDGVPTRCHLPWELASSVPASQLIPPRFRIPWHSFEPQKERLFQGDLTTFRTPEQYPNFSARTSFELPVDSNGLFLLANGVLYTGVARLTTYEPQHHHDKILVDVHLSYWAPKAIDRVNVCTLKNGEAHGAGIYLPTSQSVPGKLSTIWVRVDVAFPASRTSPLLLRSFTTNFPLLDHMVEDLKGLVSFDTLHLRGTRAPIIARSLQAQHLILETSFSSIVGRFNASRLLSLKTNNGFIEADVGIQSTLGESPTELKLQTSNGYIRSNISLGLTNEIGSTEFGGSYRIKAETTNGQIRLNFPTSPKESQLDLDAQTSNSPAEIYLNSAFQGDFEFSTTDADSVHLGRCKDCVYGPGNRVPQRKLELKPVVGGVHKGDVWWGDTKNETVKGDVRAKTTNGYFIFMLDSMEDMIE